MIISTDSVWTYLIKWFLWKLLNCYPVQTLFLMITSFWRRWSSCWLGETIGYSWIVTIIIKNVIYWDDIYFRYNDVYKQKIFIGYVAYLFWLCKGEFLLALSMPLCWDPEETSSFFLSAEYLRWVSCLELESTPCCWRTPLPLWCVGVEWAEE